jgi:hypothetical protein
MSKNTKQAKSTPEIYQGLSIEGKQEQCVVEDVHMLFYIFDNTQSIHILKQAIQKTWAKGLTDFLEEGKQTMLAYHENLFKCNAPKDQDPTVTAQYTWAKIVSIAIDRRTTKVPVLAGRKSTIGLCEYRKGSNIDQPNLLKTPQANACLKLFIACIESNTEPRPDDKDGNIDIFVTEEVLRQYIVDHAAELHTRQDPWRIFQYYRPQLISEKLITRK